MPKKMSKSDGAEFDVDFMAEFKEAVTALGNTCYAHFKGDCVCDQCPSIHHCFRATPSEELPERIHTNPNDGPLVVARRAAKWVRPTGCWQEVPVTRFALLGKTRIDVGTNVDDTLNPIATFTVAIPLESIQDASSMGIDWQGRVVGDFKRFLKKYVEDKQNVMKNGKR